MTWTLRGVFEHPNTPPKYATDIADIADALRKYDSSVHPVGEGLPESTRVYRVNVVMAMLKAGLPIHKIDCFRSLLEELSVILQYNNRGSN